jgi:short subunit dehydrogenase-like uncharacterized protein
VSGGHGAAPAPRDGRRLLVYGATGFTGRLVVDEVRRRGLDPVLGGRDRTALEALAEEVGGAEVRIADALRPETLAPLFDGIGCVVSCAGPFARLGEPVLRAAIEAAAHYLDTTGEQAWMARAMDLLSADAERRGTTAVLAHAFEYAIGDCLVRIGIEEVPGAETVEVFNRVEGFGTSRGTKKSALDALLQPTLAVVNGRRHEEPPFSRRARVRFPDEEELRTGVSFGGGEVLSAPGYAASVRTVRTHLVVPPGLAWVLPVLARGGAPLLRSRLRRVLERRIDASGFGPGEERREQLWWVLARVRAPGGRGVRVTASGYDSYGITAVLGALGARWLLEGRARATGVVTTARAFEPRALLGALADSGVSWRIDPIDRDGRSEPGA